MKVSLLKLVGLFFLELGLLTAHAQSLSIGATQNKSAQITWASGITDLVLESADVLGPSALWRPVTQTAVLGNNEYSVTLDASGGARFFRLHSPPLTTIRETSPANGETGVAVIRETIVRFTAPLGTNAMVTGNNFYAGYGGRRLLSRVELSSDRTKATLFYLEPLPGSTRIRAVFDGNGLSDAMGRPLDADGDGQGGGSREIVFDTLSLTAVLGTAMIGHVYASELTPGADTGKNAVNRPLEGVTITVDGKEESLRTTTDALGNFKLEPCPAGRFFVKIDGRTAKGSQWPKGDYYPFVGKAWDAVAGRTDNLAGGTGEIFLPLIMAGTLQSVSPSTDTTITFPPSVVANNPALAGVTITVPANSLFGDDGMRGGKVGIAPVPPDRLPGPLPPGLEASLVITVQTDGPLNFDKPAPVCFPNLPDPVLGAPLAAGSKQALFSFNHKKGIWEAVGSMTVSADGKLVCTDPGVGILQPGWNLTGPPPLSPPPPAPSCPDIPVENIDYRPFLRCIRPRCDRSLWDFCSSEVDFAKDARDRWCELPHANQFGPNQRPRRGESFLQYCMRRSTDVSLEEQRLCAAKFNACPGPTSLQDSFGATRALQSLQSPTPSIDDQINQILDQISALIAPLGLNDVPSPALRTQIDALRAQADAVAGGSADQYFVGKILADEEEIAKGEAEFGPWPGNAPSYPVSYMAEVRRGDGSILELRGETGPFGAYQLFVPRDGQLMQISFYDKQTKWFGHQNPRLSKLFSYQIPSIELLPLDPSTLDTDKDGLPDVVEFVLGTDPANPDTDGDGIPDGAEVDQGTDPLDGRLVRNGIVASADTPGPAVDICVMDNVAVVAEQNRGVALFNVFPGLNPTLIAEVRTPGAAQRVACSGSLIAVADGPRGLAVIDISNPATATLTHQVGLSAGAQSVAAIGNLAYVASGMNVVLVDMRSGLILDQREYAGGAVLDITVGGGFAYLISSPAADATLHTVSKIRIDAALTGAIASIGINDEAIEAPALVRIMAGGGFIYVATIDDLSDRTAPGIEILQDLGAGFAVVGRPTSALTATQVALTGSGQALVANFSNVALLDVRDPAKTETDQFITLFPTPGYVNGISIYNGLAYVADGDGGLQVINYLAYDSKGVPPTISLSSASFPLNPAAATERTDVRVTANATDDVQVRSVEFYIDGFKASTDGSFPFEFDFQTPAITPSKKTFTLRAKATDTGGNFAWSEEITIKLNYAAPAIVNLTPADGASDERFSLVSVQFNEAINPATITAASFTLTEAGPDGRFGTADDVPVTNGVIQQRSDGAGASLNFSGGLPRGRYRAKISGSVANLNGILLGSDQAWEFSVLGRTTLQGLVKFEDGRPAAGAEVRLIGLEKSVTTDANGRFSLPDLILPLESPPALEIKVLAAGEPLFAKLTLSALADRGVTDEGTITLHPLCDAQLVAATFPNRDLDSPVNVFAIFNDGTGSALYAGGPFGVAKWTGTKWLPLGDFVPVAEKVAVNALAVFDDGTGSALYAGGNFASSGGVTLNNVAKWDGTKWTSVGGGVTGPSVLLAQVFAFAVFNDGTGPALWVSGDHFDKAGDVPVSSVAKWNGRQWAALGTVSPSDSTGYHALTVFDDGTGPALYGGDSKWDGTQWLKLGGGLPGRVDTMTVFDDGTGPALYVGGQIYQSIGAPGNGVVKWNGSQWLALGSGTGGISGGVAALAVFNDGAGPALFAGGEGVARWKDGAWTTIDRKLPDFNVVTGAGTVGALTVFDDGTGAKLYVGGSFLSAMAGTNIVPARGVASWDGTAWAPLAQSLSAGKVKAFAEFKDATGEALYVGGAFALAGMRHASSVAKWDGNQFLPLGSGMGGDVAYGGPEVDALAVFNDGTGSALYAGGVFETAGDVVVNGIAKWTGAAWSGLGSGLLRRLPDLSTLPGRVNALIAFDDGTGPALFVGGQFDSAGGIAAANIAKWNGNQWSPLGSGLTGQILALAVWDDGGGPALYAGGAITQIVLGRESIFNIAKWTGSDWVPVGPGLNGGVQTLTVFNNGTGSALYAGGDFRSTAGGANPTMLDNVAKWDGESWSSVGTTIGTFGTASVNVLVGFDDGTGPALYAGGWRIGGMYGTFAKWDGTNWTPLAPFAPFFDCNACISTAAPINALGIFESGQGNALFLGGSGSFIRSGGIRFDLAKWYRPSPPCP